ncbi:DUF6350 family protein [Amycolatopsis anabasis]|uniref:cell division protein PerM n=1 Tax=Amycolatopsis anabasis TaxID=1840409 RepID=UPI0015D16AEA|nr:DUF6350 family protein [Amycolatopsis anabasis]
MQLLTRHAQPGGERLDEEFEPPPGLTGIARVRVLISAAVGPLVTGYAVVAALLALVTAAASEAHFSTSGVLLAAGPGWLAAYQVPIEITGRPLGMLPLLATVGAVLLVARTASGAAHRLGCREPAGVIPVIGTIALAHAALGVTIALLLAGRPLSVDPLAAFLVPGLLAALAATAGVAGRCGLASMLADRLDPIAVHGLRAGALGMAALLVCGAIVSAFATAWSAPTAHGLFTRNAPGLGSGLGMFLLSLGYLPNAIVFGLGFAAGPGFSIGSVSVGPFGFTGGPVPGLPVLAGIPEQYAAWWPALLALPAVAGALVGWSLRRAGSDRLARLRTVGVAGALVGFGCVVLGTLAGGRLGNGPFDPVGIPVGLVSVAAFCWIAFPGGLVAWFAGPNGPAEEPPAEAEPLEPLPEAETEPPEDVDEEPEAEDTDAAAEEPAEAESDTEDTVEPEAETGVPADVPVEEAEASEPPEAASEDANPRD